MIVTNLFRNSQDTKAFAKGEVIFSAGDEGKVMYVVMEGEVDITIHGKTMETVGPGGIVGEMALIEHKPRTATVVARADCKLVTIDEQRFSFLVQQTPYFALHLMKVMADRLRRTDEQI